MRPGHAPDHVSRRIVVGGAVMAPILAAYAGPSPATEALTSQLLARCKEQARLFNTGEMVRWLAVADPGDSFTLMQPFGGGASHGFDRSPAHLASIAAQFRNGDAAVELAQAVVSDKLAVLAYVERQQIEVAGLPKQDWSLRVTQVFERQGDDWKLMHRHADPLVRGISLDVAAALASGRLELNAEGTR